MAGVPISSRTVQSGSQPWTTKAVNAVSTVGKGIAIANGIREATPVVMGAMRTALRNLRKRVQESLFKKAG